ncbi:PBP1A family penicillin-binding protein [Bacillus sp. FSL W7-1360]
MNIATRNKRRRFKKLYFFFRFSLIVAIALLLSLIVLLSYVRMQGPPPIDVTGTTEFLAADATLLVSGSTNSRKPVSLEEMSPHIVDATVAIEDRRFYGHWGFDIKRIGGSILANIRTGSRSQGASTITQQYARNLYLTHEKTWLRKWNELLYSLRLEAHFSKEDILAGYLNTVYYGHGAYGIEAAAQHFFGKSAKDLSLAESAMLAGVPKGPSYYSPLVDLEKAQDRQAIILASMVEMDFITEQEAQQAKEEPLNFVKEVSTAPQANAPYFLDHVKATLQANGQMDDTGTDHLTVHTTLDPNLQQEAESIIDHYMPDSDLQVALVAIDPRTAEVKAFVGGKDYAESPFNRATQAKRNPGSTMKPFLYYAALENGFTPVSTFLSEATSFTYDNNKTYAPRNFNDVYANDYITMLEAIAYSDNIYALKTHLSIGQDELVTLSDRLGLGSFAEQPSLALGAQPVSILDMANAYTALANGGKLSAPVFIKKVVDENGKESFKQEAKFEEVLDEATTYVLTDMMKAVFEPSLNSYTSVTGGSVAKQLTHPTAGKSGSTPRDSWMVGYTPQLVTVVWTGYDKDKNINQAAEGHLAKRIWADFMEKAMADELTLPFTKPLGVTSVMIDPHTGLLATDACPGGRETSFLEGTAPVKSCENPEAAEDLQEEPDKKEDGFFKRLFKWFRIEDGVETPPQEHPVEGEVELQ